MTKTNTNQKGFTIVELLIVIVVISILAALVVSTFSGIQGRARDVKRDTDAASVIKAAEAYNAQNGKYPTMTEITGASNTIAPLDSTVSGKLQATPAPDGTTNKDKYQYLNCGTGAGVQVKYWAEAIASPAVQTRSAGVTTGTCS